MNHLSSFRIAFLKQEGLRDERRQEVHLGNLETVLVVMVDEDCSSTTILRSFPGQMKTCWNRDIPVPRNESLVVVELRLWSALSIAAVVNSLLQRLVGQTTFSFSNQRQTSFPRSMDMLITLS